MLSILSTFVLAASVSAVEVQTLDGTVVSGSLAELTADQVSLDTDEGPVALSISQLQKIRFNGTPAQSTTPVAWIELVDGTRLSVGGLTVSNQQAQVTPLSGGQQELPVRIVRAVRFKQQDKQQRDQWDKVRARPVRSDLIVIRKGERIDYLEGVLGDVSDDKVQFRLDDEVVPVGRAKVEGIVYYHATDNSLPPATFRVSDVYGGQFEGSEWTVREQVMRIRTPAGYELQRRFDEILQIDFSADKILFLGDLTPISVRWQPYFAADQLDEDLRSFYRPRVDQAMGGSKSSADSGKLQLWIDRGGSPSLESYEKGLALQSRTEVTYRLPDGVRYFRALAGIDARVREFGHVHLRIEGDGRELFAADISGNDQPQDLSLNVAGVRQLMILVDYGDNLDIGDHLNLCNARLIK